MRMISGMSNSVTPSKKERVMNSSRKQRCLFNTMHVKTAMGLLTVFYLFGLAVLDNYLYWQEMSYFESLFLSIFSIVIIITIITAQFGLNFEKHRLIFPFFIVQSLFLGAIYVGYSRSIAQQFFYAQLHSHVIVRLILIMLYEAILMTMHTYALLVTIRCIVYFRNKKLRSLDRLSYNNRCFLDGVSNAKNLKDRIVNLRIDVTTDEEDAQSINYALDSNARKLYGNRLPGAIPSLSSNVIPATVSQLASQPVLQNINNTPVSRIKSDDAPKLVNNTNNNNELLPVLMGLHTNSTVAAGDLTNNINSKRSVTFAGTTFHDNSDRNAVY